MLDFRYVMALVGGTMLVGGCSTVPYAREVKKRPGDGGMIALRSQHSPEDRALAENLMRSNCVNGKVRVLEEGETVVGMKTNSDARTSNEGGHGSGFSIGALSFGSSKPYQQTSGTSETTQLTEWQISYECEAGGAPSASVPVSGIRKASGQK